MIRKKANGRFADFFSGSQRLGTYELQSYEDEGGEIQYRAVTRKTELYLGRKRVASEDRLGSAKDARLLPYGEEISTTPNERVKFATYQRDQTGVDSADQRYYQPGNGRFLTADPYMASGRTDEPSSWNRYAYVEGDPVNLNDPLGLERSPPTGCLIDGIWHPSTECDVVLLPRTVVRQPSRSNRAAAALNAAQDALAQRRVFSAKCLGGLEALGVDGRNVVAHAGSMGIANGTRGQSSDRSIADAYGNTSLGHAAQFEWDNGEKTQAYRARTGVATIRVRDVFASQPGTTAWTPFRGGVIYINRATLKTVSSAQNQGLLCMNRYTGFFG